MMLGRREGVASWKPKAFSCDPSSAPSHRSMGMAATSIRPHISLTVASRKVPGGLASTQLVWYQVHPVAGTLLKGSSIRNRNSSHLLTDVAFCSFFLGYEPMKGDWVQVKYFINPTQWTSQAQSVAPLRYCRLDQVKKKKRRSHVSLR